MSFNYLYPRPAVTVDAIIVSENNQVLLIQRKNDPFKDCWAFPGGFVDKDEDPNDAVHRELEEETGLTGLNFKQIGTFGKPGRDPRGHTISICYLAKIKTNQVNPTAADDAKAVEWFELNDLPHMAFDHAAILAEAI